MNFSKIKSSKSLEIFTENKLSPKKILKKRLSAKNIKHKSKNNNKSYEKEEFGYELEQTSKIEEMDKNKTFEINKKNNINDEYKSSIFKPFEYNNCLTNNSNNHINEINKSPSNKNAPAKTGAIFDNNKEYIIMQKSKNRNNNNNNKTYIINKANFPINVLTENISDPNNIIYNNFKTYEYNIDDDKNKNLISSKKFGFDEISMVSKIKSEENNNINITGDEDYFFKDNEIQNNDITKYKIIINKLNKEKLELEEKLRNEYLTNKELKNYIEILKQTIENNLIKYGVKNIVDNASKDLNKNSINLLTEFTKYKSENEKIKKNLIIQQILTTEMKNEIEKIKNENENLKKVKSINTNNLNYNYLNINNNSKEERLDNLSKINKELNNNYLNLQNDFKLLNQNNEDIIKYNQKLINENEEYKKEIKYLKEIYIKEKKKLCDDNDNENEINIIDNNNININELINKINILENNNSELKNIIEKQKNEINDIKNSVNVKNNELNKCYNEIEKYKNNNNRTNDIIKQKEEEILNLKSKNENIEKMINQILDNEIKQDINKIKEMRRYANKDTYNNNVLIKYINDIIDINKINDLQSKIKTLQILISLLIKEIIKLDEKLNNKFENGQIFKNGIFSDKKKDNKERIIKINEDINNSFEEFSIIKQKENQNNSNNDIICFSNNNIINDDKDDYIIIENKLNNIIEKQNLKNGKNNDSIKEGIKYDNDKNKIFIQKQNINIKKTKINNNNFIKSFSSKIIKNNTLNNILNNKIKEEKINSQNYNKNEEEKININDFRKQIKKTYNNNNEESNNKQKDFFYITMPNKFTKIQNTLTNYRQPKIHFSNISYLNDTLFKNSKYNQGTQTNDTSSRIFTSNFLSINNESSLRNKKNVKIIKNSQLNALKKNKNFQNNIQNNKKEKKDRQNLANEVLKPSFLRSDVASTFLNYYHSNPISNKNKNNNRNLSHELF